MKKLSLIILLAMTGRVIAQTNVYHEFPDSNATWNIVAQGCCWTGCPGPPTPNPIIGDYVFSYSIAGDTIINSTAYRSLYKSGSAHEHCSAGNYINNWYYYNDYAGGFREDTALHHVYLMQPFFTTECLLYDFTAGVGDTINFCEGCAIVLSIDSVLIGNNFRKRWNLSSQTTPYSVIEGIGSTSGLLEPLCPFEYFGTLTCFTQENQTLYPDTVTTCDFITDIAPVDRYSQQLQIVPNPVSTQATLLVQFQMRDATLSILNCVGETVLEVQNINGFSVAIDCVNLPNGVYFFRVTENDVVVGTGKAVIAN